MVRRRKSRRQYAVLFSVFFGLLLLDILSKSIVRIAQPDYRQAGFFSITFIQNTGAAFGILQGGGLLFIIAASAFLLGIAYYIYNNGIPANVYYIISIGLVSAGAMGNLIDRIAYGSVTDFISFSFFPAFNVADICITIGAGLFLMLFFLDVKVY